MSGMDWTAIANSAANVANAIVTPVQNALTQKRQQAENEKNRAFAVYQADMQYRREKEMLKNADSYKVQSLKNAGLNPALAYGGEAPTLNPTMGATPEGKVAQPIPIGPALQGLGASALQFDAQAFTRSETRKNNAEAEAQEIENGHTKSTDEVIQALNDPEKLNSLVLKDAGSVEGLNKIQEHKKLKAEAKLQVVSAKVNEWTADIKMKYPQLYEATLARDAIQNENTQMDTSLKESQISNVEQDTKLKGAQTSSEQARYGLIKAQTAEAIAHKHNLDMDTFNKLLQQDEIKANIEKMNSLTQFYSARTATERVNRWLKLDASMSATVGYLQELQKQGKLTDSEREAIEDLFKANAVKVVGNFIGRTIEHAVDSKIDSHYSPLRNSSSSATGTGNGIPYEHPDDFRPLEDVLDGI